MFNPTKLDEVCVQATHLEARGKNVLQLGSKNPFKGGDKGKGKFKGKWKKNVDAGLPLHIPTVSINMHKYIFPRYLTHKRIKSSTIHG